MGFTIETKNSFTPPDFAGYQVNPDVLMAQGVSADEFNLKYDDGELMVFFAQGKNRQTNQFQAFFIKFTLGPLVLGPFRGGTTWHRKNVLDVTNYVRSILDTTVPGTDRQNSFGGKEIMLMPIGPKDPNFPEGASYKNVCYYNKRLGAGGGALVMRICEIEYINETSDLKPVFDNFPGLC